MGRKAFLALFAIAGCGGGVSEVSSANGAATFQTKCKASISGCIADAREQCHGDFRTVATEQHAGGIFADALPGPVTWHTLRFACGAPEDYHAEVEEVIAASVAQIYWPVCEVPPRPGKACGLLANKFTSEWVASYTNHICHEDSDQPSDRCVARIITEFHDDLAARYTLANGVDIASACTSTPAQCSTPWRLELLFVTSHDDVIFKREKRGIDDILARAAQDGQATDAAREELAQENTSRQEAGAALAVAGAAFKGFADGWNASQSGNTNTAPYVTPSSQDTSSAVVQTSNGCTSDYTCGPGFACVKNQFQSTGVCAKKVNAYGLQTFSPPDPSSVGVGHPDQCSFDTDCSPGFRCSKGSGIRGTCMK